MVVHDKLNGRLHELSKAVETMADSLYNVSDTLERSLITALEGSGNDGKHDKGHD